MKVSRASGAWACVMAMAVAMLVGCDDRQGATPAGGAVGSVDPANAGGKRVRVVCTTTMIADVAQQIAGDMAVVHGIMKTGEDPHVYEPRPRDAQDIAAADLVLANGLHLEATLTHIIEHNAGGKVVYLAESPGITPLGSKDKQGAPDPHCWFNIEYFKVYALRAGEALAEVDPAHAEDYRSRAADYAGKLDELHAWVKRELDSVPAEQRVMVTSHDAFQYFGAAYGVEVHAVIGMSTEQQPRPQDIAALEELVRSHNIRALFIETSVSNTLNEIVRKVAASTGARIGGTLYSDSLGEPGTEAGTYIGMIRHSVRTLVEALQ